MTRNEFLQAFKPITEAFGERKYPAAITQRLFIQLHALSADYFGRRMNDLLFSSSRPPTPAEICAACGPELSKMRDLQQQLAVKEMLKRAKCDHCDLSGWLYATSNNPDHFKAEFSFRCPYCSAAATRRVHTLVPLWEPERHGKDFTLKDFGSPTHKATNERIQGVLREVSKALGVNVGAEARAYEADRRDDEGKSW